MQIVDKHLPCYVGLEHRTCCKKCYPDVYNWMLDDTMIFIFVAEHEQAHVFQFRSEQSIYMIQ